MRTKLSFVIVCVLLMTCFGSRAQTEDRPDGFTFAVRTLTAIELPKDTTREWMNFFAPGVASGALGLAAPPMFASGLIVGGLLLAPGALIVSNIESKKWQQVANALKGIRFEQELLEALRRRATGRLAARGGDPVTTIELVVNAYGLTGARPERACFVASVDLLVARAGKEVLRDRLVISEIDRSNEAPPAQCASLDRFAEHDGRLVRDTAAEYSEVLAALAIDRVAGLIRQ